MHLASTWRRRLGGGSSLHLLDRTSRPREAETMGSFKVAVVQAASVVFDCDATLDKLAKLSAEASAGGAVLSLFPEAFVSGYPRGVGFGSVVGYRTAEGREQFRRYWESS